MYRILCVLVVSQCLCGHDGQVTGFKIFRSARDVFTNMKCTGDSLRQCTKDQCVKYGAECADDENCKFCSCMKDMNTFVSNTDGSDGVCKGDEKIDAESVPKERFWLENKVHGKCLKAQTGSGNYVSNVTGENCTSPTLDMLWIWTKTKKKMLMNVKTLRCMERPNQDGNTKITMQPCKEKLNLQRIRCNKKASDSRIKMQWQQNRYLHLSKTPQYAIVERTTLSQAQSWSSNKANFCDEQKEYKGCYRFSDGSFMAFLNYSESNPSRNISAPIFTENDGKCTILKKIEFTKRGQKWETRRTGGSLFSIDDGSTNTKKIRVSKMEKLKILNGTLLKLYVKCKQEEHCVLLKLESLPRFSTMLKTSPRPTSMYTRTSQETSTTNVETTATTVETIKTTSQPRPKTDLTKPQTRDIPPSMLTVASKPSRQSPNSETPTTGNPKGGLKEKSESSGTNSVTIPVTVTLLLVALVLVLGFLVYNRRRKRLQQPANNSEADGAVNYSKEMLEDSERVYEVLREETQEAQGKQSGISSDTYTYPDNKFITNPNPASSQLEYTYAKDTDIPRINQNNTNATPEVPPSTPVYHTLEAEKAPSSDFYTYVEPNNITPPASNELEYTYAKDTEIPRAANPTPTELEYSYAKNTDIPLIPVRTGITDQENSASPTKNDLYHTLEEPSPPQAPVYSTLEEAKEKATNEIANSSDSMNIDVIS